MTSASVTRRSRRATATSSSDRAAALFGCSAPTRYIGTFESMRIIDLPASRYPRSIWASISSMSAVGPWYRAAVSMASSLRSMSAGAGAWRAARSASRTHAAVVCR